MELNEAIKTLKNAGYTINEDIAEEIRNRDMQAQFGTFRKAANKILANLMFKIMNDVAEQFSDELDVSVDELWEEFGGKDEFIKAAIKDENDELLDYVGELWDVAKKAQNLRTK